MPQQYTDTELDFLGNIEISGDANLEDLKVQVNYFITVDLQ